MRAILTALSLLACATPALAVPPAADAPILATVQRFFDALAKQDAATMRQIVLPGGMYTAVQPLGDGTTTVRRLPVDETFSKTIGAGLHERMWAPVVSTRGPISTVSTPYEFQVNSKTTHCGIDVFSLVKVEGEWKIASLMWTQEPDACPELKARK